MEKHVSEIHLTSRIRHLTTFLQFSCLQLNGMKDGDKKLLGKCEVMKEREYLQQLLLLVKMLKEMKDVTPISFPTTC